MSNNDLKGGKDNNNVSDILSCCCYGEIDSLKQKLSKLRGMQLVELINQPDTMGLTPLHEACRFGHHNIVLYLLQLGANPYAVNLAKQTPLHMAAGGGHMSCVEQLVTWTSRLKQGDAMCDEGENDQDDQQEDEKLVEMGAKRKQWLAALDSQGRSAVDWASRNGHSKLERYLIMKGAGVNHSFFNAFKPHAERVEEYDDVKNEDVLNLFRPSVQNINSVDDDIDDDDEQEEDILMVDIK